MKKTHPKRSKKQLFDRVVQQVLRDLPPDLRGALGTVQIVIQKKASSTQLRRSGVEKDAVLFGLFEGLSLKEWPLGMNRSFPDRIILYEEALRKSFPDPKELTRQVRITLVHELGHYFGFSERELSRRGWA